LVQSLKKENNFLKTELTNANLSLEKSKKEIDAINYHRTVLKSTVEEMESKLCDAVDQIGFQVGTPAESEEGWEIFRYKNRIQGLNRLCKIYRTGILALYGDNDDYSSDHFGKTECLPWLDWIQRDLILQNFFEEEIRILDSRIDELQLKLRQYRKYGLEVRKQFEEILKSIHRYGHHAI
jgi:chromosome segregation ATPase